MSMPFHGQIGIVTGAGSGIGRAIAVRFAELGGTPCLVGRDRSKLDAVADVVREGSSEVLVRACDLTRDDDLQRLADGVTNLRRLDLVVHSAAEWDSESFLQTTPALLDGQYSINVRAPHALTRLLLPQLEQSRGQIVFMNSSAVYGATPGLTAYGSMKRALKGLADHLRSEVNSRGVRVLSVFAGRTATPMQRRVSEKEGKPYRPKLLLQPEDVASVVAHVLALPRTAEVTEIHIRPMRKT